MVVVILGGDLGAGIEDDGADFDGGGGEADDDMPVRPTSKRPGRGRRLRRRAERSARSGHSRGYSICRVTLAVGTVEDVDLGARKRRWHRGRSSH